MEGKPEYRIRVHWDTQDPRDPGWAWVLSRDGQDIASGALTTDTTADDNSLELAAEYAAARDQAGSDAEARNDWLNDARPATTVER